MHVAACTVVRFRNELSLAIRPDCLRQVLRRICESSCTGLVAGLRSENTDDNEWPKSSRICIADLDALSLLTSPGTPVVADRIRITSVTNCLVIYQNFLWTKLYTLIKACQWLISRNNSAPPQLFGTKRGGGPIFSIRAAKSLFVASISRILTKARIIRMFICTARSLPGTEDSIATPCSVSAYGR